ncbi:hypothetical protein AYI69_g6935 [Smittium culicis]|uniref:Uncharacterized protein n=1 Tax=Smittium culicis TaxID=133412 RepID=A0A1R1XVF3_9FUNG|nr:hypothetical protein AYI69_g6935 [Smittium culicis]
MDHSSTHSQAQGCRFVNLGSMCNNTPHSASIPLFQQPPVVAARSLMHSKKGINEALVEKKGLATGLIFAYGYPRIARN